MRRVVLGALLGLAIAGALLGPRGFVGSWSGGWNVLVGVLAWFAFWGALGAVAGFTSFAVKKAPPAFGHRRLSTFALGLRYLPGAIYHRTRALSLPTKVRVSVALAIAAVITSWIIARSIEYSVAPDHVERPNAQQRAALATHVVHVTSKAMDCRLQTTCQFYQLRISLVNRSLETIKTLWLGWSFPYSGVASCPTSYPSKYSSPVTLRPGDTITLTAEGYDGPSQTPNDICVGVTGVEIQQ